ncbi:hypothetical protein M406DRAFT_323931 [Cryphonectria parasitica EP155]|uniref:Rhodopsin domain-containing protein n=1 Tax=Cryphonectria parasitica (strain ATCC 38755 / EP155) TaxID=660469 RepID=A0A9P4XVH5_CRYP1|nr:uncharacterized protein M406DRAFT_323931 [Cryphonectria parasitica EP155]KAF3761577.1 hypothetical protein M406DRAFT_323931 [Cryphonectria parasitica EP155]
MSALYDLVGLAENLHEPEPPLNHRPVAFGLIISLMVVSVLCACARLYVRFKITRCPGWDDVFVILSVITGTSLAISVLVGFDYHMGEHLVSFLTPDPTSIEDFIKTIYVSSALYTTSTTLIKIAILLQYLRVFAEKSRYRMAAKILLIIVALWGSAFSFVSWFPAFPISAIWDFANTSAIRFGFSSLNPNETLGAYLALSATNMLLDLAMLAIILPYLVTGVVASNSRLYMTCLVLVGVIINLVSLIRLVQIIQSRGGTYPNLDPTWYLCSPIVLSSLEVSLAIVAASLPVFWPVLKHNCGHIFVTTEITVTQEDSQARDHKTAWEEMHPWSAGPDPESQTGTGSISPQRKRSTETDRETLIGSRGS